MACGDQDEVAKPTNELIRRALAVVNGLQKRPCSKDKALSYLVGHATGSTRLDPELAERQGARMRVHVGPTGQHGKAVAALEKEARAALLKVPRLLPIQYGANGPTEITRARDTAIAKLREQVFSHSPQHAGTQDTLSHMSHS